MNTTLPIRPWPTVEQIAAAQVDGSDRKWSCFDFSGCRHNSSAIVYVGTWQVEVCNDCGHANVECIHDSCEWNEEGSLLRCTTCGIDAT